MTPSQQYIDWHDMRIGRHLSSAGCETQLPVIPTLQKYVDQQKLSLEQRYWLALLFGLTYSIAGPYHVFNLYPRIEEIDFKELEEWWFRDARTGPKAIRIDKDRRWVRSLNYFVPCIKKYREQCNAFDSQDHFFRDLVYNIDNPYDRYEKIYNWANELPSFGQFSLFCYTEALQAFTDLDLRPYTLNLKESPRPRQGLAFAYNLPYTEKEVPPWGWGMLASALSDLRERFESHSTLWSSETTLCDFGKFKHHPHKEWHSYDPSLEGYEIASKEHQIDFIDWKPLWDIRESMFSSRWRIEDNYSKEELRKGIPTEWSDHWIKFTKELHQ